MFKKYLFFDYDGTLSDDMRPINRRVITALENAKRAGHKIFICSGRCRYMLPEIEEVCFDGYVLACGTDVRVGNKRLIDHTVAHPSFEECVRLALDKGMAFVAEGENIAVTIPTGPESWNCPSAANYDEFEKRFGETAVINKFSILNPCTDDIIGAAEKNGFAYIDHTRTGEFVPAGFSKVTGIKAVLDYYGAGVGDSIAFGDSMNDYEMIRFSGTGIAMGNSVEALKHAADFVTKSVSDDGVAYYINDILLKQGEYI